MSGCHAGVGVSAESAAFRTEGVGVPLCRAGSRQQELEEEERGKSGGRCRQGGDL
jgi:hypothetical protein